MFMEQDAWVARQTIYVLPVKIFSSRISAFLSTINLFGGFPWSMILLESTSFTLSRFLKKDIGTFIQHTARWWSLRCWYDQAACSASSVASKGFCIRYRTIHAVISETTVKTQKPFSFCTLHTSVIQALAMIWSRCLHDVVFNLKKCKEVNHSMRTDAIIFQSFLSFGSQDIT